LIEFTPSFNLEEGLDTRVLLPDGSQVYSIKQNEQSESQVVSGIHSYKMNKKKLVDEQAVALFIDLIRYLRSRKFDVLLVMTPYHPYVWEHEDQTVVAAMNLVDQKVQEIANITNVPIVGSFQPKLVDCSAEEFRDDMHAKRICLEKLEQRTISPHSMR
jgi:hypothetical protein